MLTKQTLMEQFDRVAADPRLRLAAVEAHAASGDPGSRLGDEFHVFSTSGTTGRRGLFPQTASEFERWMAAAWRARGRIGLDAGARVVGIGAPTPLHITRSCSPAPPPIAVEQVTEIEREPGTMKVKVVKTVGA